MPRREYIRFVVERKAATNIARKSDWWREHRTYATYTFNQVLRRYINSVRQFPWIGPRGQPVGAVQHLHVWRVHMPEIHEWLYYQVVYENNDDRLAPVLIRVLDVWGDPHQRSHPPDMLDS